MDKNITSNKKTFKLKIIIYICWLVGIERLENSKEMMITDVWTNIYPVIVYIFLFLY